MNKFDSLAVMIDCSRNAVMNIKELKNYISIMAKMGYNEVQLYMEDTYEVTGEEYFGYLRGRYSKSELKELDDYCFEIGIELVPCIQTLAHLITAMRWPEYSKIKDIDDILLVGEERTYTLIENMMSSLRQCFRSEKIHIGMDEAHNLGRGEYLDRHGFVDRNKMFLEHLKRVCGIADKYGFKPMMWSDMFFRIANGTGLAYHGESKFSEELKSQIPENLSVIYWDYYNLNKKIYSEILQKHKRLSDKIIFAAGAWSWAGFASHNEFSVPATAAALTACTEHGIKDIIMTCWGDNGGECSMYSVLPTLCYAACFNKGIMAMDEIKENFKKWVGYEFDDFMLLDLPDKLIKTNGIITPSKYYLYNDCFLGIFDPSVAEEDSKLYSSYNRLLESAEKRVGEYSHIFRTSASLCKLLSIKVDIGNKTRNAYKNRDKSELLLIAADYEKMIGLAEELHRCFKDRWFKENKPHGFDVQDIRLGGLIMRIKSCYERLLDYCNGAVDSIEELEEEILPLYTEKIEFNDWQKTVSVNPI